MSITNILGSLAEFFRQITIQAVGAVVGALIIGLFAGYSLSEGSGDDKQKQSAEVVTRSDLRRAIEEAKLRLIATGYVISDVNANLINAKPHNFDATLVFVEPLGTGKSNSVICQRQRDEGDSSGFDDYGEIIKKIKQFRSPDKTGSLIGNRLKLGVIDLYPTMTVLIVDNDLYAYFYPYGEASNSPVIKFSNYWNAKEKDKRGKFFDDHLNKITWYRGKVDGSKTKFLVTDSDFAPYYKALQNPCY